MVRERVVDVSDLPAPEPLGVISAALRELGSGEYLRVLHRREPIPLYASLAEHGFAHRAFAGEATAFEILIWRRDDPLAAAECGEPDSPPPPGGARRGCG